MNPYVPVTNVSLRLARQHADLSLSDLALRLDTDPQISHRSRTELLGQIESGFSPINISLLVALKTVAPSAFAWIDLDAWVSSRTRWKPMPLVAGVDLGRGEQAEDAA